MHIRESQFSFGFHVPISVFLDENLIVDNVRQMHFFMPVISKLFLNVGY